MQSEFIALQGERHDFTNLKQEFDPLELNKYIKWRSSNSIKQKSQKSFT